MYNTVTCFNLIRTFNEKSSLPLICSVRASSVQFATSQRRPCLIHNIESDRDWELVRVYSLFSTSLFHIFVEPAAVAAAQCNVEKLLRIEIKFNVSLSSLLSHSSHPARGCHSLVPLPNLLCVCACDKTRKMETKKAYYANYIVQQLIRAHPIPRFLSIISLDNRISILFIQSLSHRSLALVAYIWCAAIDTED